MKKKTPQLGISLSVKMSRALTNKKLEIFMDDWIGFIESKGLFCGGGYSAQHMNFFLYREKESATNADRQAIRMWLKKFSHIKTILIGRPIDVNV